MDEITLTTILYKYKDQQPKQFGEDFGEKCYPVSAILNICEEYHQMMKEREQKEPKQQSNCNLPHVSGALPLTEHQITELANIGSGFIYEGIMEEGRISEIGIMEIIKKYEEFKGNDR